MKNAGAKSGYRRAVAHSFGGPDVLTLEHVAKLPEPDTGEVRIRVEAAGVGYTDTILRRGRYVAYTGGLPLTPGYDVAGRVDALGPEVAGVAIGDHVADMPVHGAYSEYLIRPARDLIPVPAGVPATAAVEVPLMWMTAWQMLTRVASLPPQSLVLVVGASGSVGRALVMLARHLGHDVIGTASAENLPLVEGLGANALDYRCADLGDAIKTASGGKKVAAAFDAVGSASWFTSWDALGQGGLLVAYGFQDFLETGAEPAEAGRWFNLLNTVWPSQGAQDGSERRTIFYDIRERRALYPEEYLKDAQYLLALMAEGRLRPAEAEILPLSQAGDAHRRIAAGGLPHRLVLVP